MIEEHATHEWTTAVPETYCIEYGHHHLRNAEYVAQIDAHPPTVLHVGWDVVMNNMNGAIDYEKGDIFNIRRLSPAEVEERARAVRAFVDAMHAAGVKVVMPYQSGNFFFGDHDKRTGLFDFFDHWDEYAEFGLGPRPEADPAEWQGVDRRPQEGHEGIFIYEPCINHPGWRQHLRMTTSWVARLGYDALFSDVNAHHCHKPSCQEAFRRYLSAKYGPADLQRLFGFAGPDDVRMGKSGDGLLWVETQRHWGQSFADLFAELTAAGRQHVRKFFILPNSSSYANIHEMYKRRTIGHNISMWAEVCPIFMYEKNEQPGRFGRTAISDSILQYKYAFACKSRAGMLLYNSHEPHAVALSNAEAAALGGGSFIQPHYSSPEVRMAYRGFFEANHDLLAGFSSHAQVGVVFFYDELYWENPSHLEQIFCLKDYLCDKHVLWDFIVEKTFGRSELAKYAVVIVPDLQHLSEAQVQMLREYAEAGGGVVLVGDAGRFTEEGMKRETLPFSEVLHGAPTQGVKAECVGKGWVGCAARIEDLIQRPAFEIFQLKEDEANDTATILKMMAEAEATKQPQGSDRLLGLCEEMSKQGLAAADEGVPFTVRVSAFRQRDYRGKRLAVHLLNYDVPIRGHRQSGPPVTATEIALRVPLPAGWQPKEVRLRGPEAVPGAAVPFEVKEGRLHVTVPRVEVYEVLEVLAD